MKTKKITSDASSEFNFDENIAEEAELKTCETQASLPLEPLSTTDMPIVEPPTSGNGALLGDETPNVLEMPQKDKRYHCHCLDCDKRWEIHSIPTFCPACKSKHIAYI